MGNRIYCECGHDLHEHEHTDGYRGDCKNHECGCERFKRSEQLTAIPKGNGVEEVDHPSHYGGADDPFEHVKVCEAKGWGYHVGNATKYLWRMGQKPGQSEIKDLKKAIWYLTRLLKNLESENGENARDSNPTNP